MEFSRQEYWILEWVVFPLPGDIPDQASNPHLLHCRQILYHGASWEDSICHECAVPCTVIHSCPTVCDRKDCSPPGSSVHGDSLGKNTAVGCHGVFPTQGSNPCLPHWGWILYHLSHQGSPKYCLVNYCEKGTNILKQRWGRICLQAHSGCWQNSFLWGCKIHGGLLLKGQQENVSTLKKSLSLCWRASSWLSQGYQDHSPFD